MKTKKIVNYDLAVIAKDKGFNEPTFKQWLHYNADEPSRAVIITLEKQEVNKPPHTDFKDHFSAPTYHQLIDWVFENFIEIKMPWEEGSRLCKMKPSEWLEFWYNHLKDCPLKGEFIYRLKELFRKQNINVEVQYDTRDSKYHSFIKDIIADPKALPRILFTDYDTYEEAEHAAIIKTFEILNK